VGTLLLQRLPVGAVIPHAAVDEIGWKWACVRHEERGVFQKLFVQPCHVQLSDQSR